MFSINEFSVCICQDDLENDQTEKNIFQNHQKIANQVHVIESENQNQNGFDFHLKSWKYIIDSKIIGWVLIKESGVTFTKQNLPIFPLLNVVEGAQMLILGSSPVTFMGKYVPPLFLKQKDKKDNSRWWLCRNLESFATCAYAITLEGAENLSRLFSHLKTNGNQNGNENDWNLSFALRYYALLGCGKQQVPFMQRVHVSTIPLFKPKMKTTNNIENKNDDGIIQTEQKTRKHPCPVFLFTSFYVCSNQDRNNELLKVFLQNAHDKQFTQVHFVVEKKDEQVAHQLFSLLPNIILHILDHQPTFCDFFCLINHVLPKGQESIVILSNSDIYFEKDLCVKLQSRINSADCFALSRYNVLIPNITFNMDKDHVCFFNNSASQDAWIFKTPLIQRLLTETMGDFCMGISGCDNRIVWEIESAGYHVTNPSQTLITFHLHASDWRPTNYHTRTKIPLPYLFVPICS